MITDNYLNNAIETIEEVKKEMEYEISRLKKHDVDTGNLEHIQRSIKKTGSFLQRMREAYL